LGFALSRRTFMAISLNFFKSETIGSILFGSIKGRIFLLFAVTFLSIVALTAVNF
jgi:hypothetical protein